MAGSYPGSIGVIYKLVCILESLDHLLKILKSAGSTQASVVFEISQVISMCRQVWEALAYQAAG